MPEGGDLNEEAYRGVQRLPQLLLWAPAPWLGTSLSRRLGAGKARLQFSSRATGGAGPSEVTGGLAQQGPAQVKWGWV